MPDQKPITFVTMLGSLRKGSFNGVIARALPSMAPAGVTIKALASVRDLPYYDADVQAEGFPAPVTAMADAIRAADGLIIVTPEYNFSVPGVLKTAIDWLSRLRDQPFAGKPIAIMSASQGLFGGARAHYHLRQSFVFLDGRVLNKPEVMVGQAQNKIAADGTITDETTKTVIAAQLKAFAEMVRQ